jgi:hypothetical protein
MMRQVVALGAAVSLIVVGCSSPAPTPPKTQLEVRQFQTRNFDTTDTKLVLKTLLNVLQDEGYQVKHASVDLGVISATKETDLGGTATTGSTETSVGPLIITALALAAIIGIAATSRGNRADVGTGGTYGSSGEPAVAKTEVIECTGNVSEHGNQTRVRVSFQRKVLSNQGDTLEVNVIDDPNFYQDFFSKVDKGLFLQEEQL